MLCFSSPSSILGRPTNQGVQMIKYKIIEKTLDVEEVDEIWCNKCGIQFNEIDIKYKHYAYFNIHWGYPSLKHGDNDDFQLCEPCYDEWIKTFVIPVTRKESW